MTLSEAIRWIEAQKGKPSYDSELIDVLDALANEIAYLKFVKQERPIVYSSGTATTTGLFYSSGRSQ